MSQGNGGGKLSILESQIEVDREALVEQGKQLGVLIQQLERLIANVRSISMEVSQNSTRLDLISSQMEALQQQMIKVKAA